MSNFYYKGKPYDFDKVITRLVDLKEKKLPRIMGQTAVNFFKDRFEEQGWRDKTLTKWRPRKVPDSGRAILVKSGNMMRAIYVKSAKFHHIEIANPMPYAEIQNDGFDGVVDVKSHTRKVSRKMKVAQSSLKTKKATSVTKKVTSGTTKVKAHKRKIHIPGRQFMGTSETLNIELDAIIISEIDKIF